VSPLPSSDPSSPPCASRSSSFRPFLSLKRPPTSSFPLHQASGCYTSCYTSCLLFFLLLTLSSSSSKTKNQKNGKKNSGPTSYALNSSRLFYPHPLPAFPSTIFEGASDGCSPHAPSTFVAVRDMMLPVLEVGGPAIRTWRASPLDEGVAANVTYLCLTTGRVVVAKPVHDWSTAVDSFEYKLLVPAPGAITDTKDGNKNGGDADARAYLDAIRSLRYQVEALVRGQATTDAKTGKPNGFTCNRPQPALQPVLDYLTFAAARAAGDGGVGMSHGLRANEQWSESGCVVEPNALFQGEVLDRDLPVVSTPTADACCSLCRARTNCTVFTWCPLTSGCASPAGAKAPPGTDLPFKGCQLKEGWRVETPTSAPHAVARGPPTEFWSGRVAAAFGGLGSPNAPVPANGHL